MIIRLFPSYHPGQKEFSYPRRSPGDVPRLRDHLPPWYCRCNVGRPDGLRPPHRPQMGYGNLVCAYGHITLPVRSRQHASVQHRAQLHGVLFPIHVQRCAIWLDT